MTSRNLFFKMMRENTKQRLWTIAVIFLLFFFLFPIKTALSVNSWLSPDMLSMYAEAEEEALTIARAQLSENFISFCSLENGGMVFLMMVLSVLCALSGFSWLHSKKKVDFFHSLPIRRELLFFVILADGFLYTAIPYLLNMAAAGVLLAVKGVWIPWGTILSDYLLHMAFYFLLYMTAVAAVLMTGNIIISFLGILVFFLWGPGTTLLCGAYFEYFFQTYYNDGEAMLWWATHSSPAGWYVYASEAASEGMPAGMALWGLAAGLAILALCVFLYRKRPSEAAGRAMAFGVSQPVIKFMLAIPFSLLGYLVFLSVTGRDGWGVFGLLCGLLLSNCVIEIIYEFDFKRLFAHRWQLAACGVISVAITAFFRFDLCGYDSYLPSDAKTEAAGIWCYDMEANVHDSYYAQPELKGTDNMHVVWTYPDTGAIAERMRLTDMETIRGIAVQGIQDAAQRRHSMFRGRRHRREYYGDATDTWGYVLVAWHLKNGRTVYRDYNMNLTAAASYLDAVYDMDEYKETAYPILSWQPEEIAGVNYQENGDTSHVAFRSEETMRQLLLTYQKELAALTAQTRRSESPVGAIQFKTREMQAMIDTLRANDGNYLTFNNNLYFPIYPSFTETIALLGECGTDVGSTLTADTVEKLVLEFRGSYPEDAERKDGHAKSETITDRARIREILESAVSREIAIEDSMNALYGDLSVRAFVRIPQENDTDEDTDRVKEEDVFAETVDETEQYGDGSEEYEVYDMLFDLDRIPDSVVKRFRLTGEMLEQGARKAY